MIDLHDHAALLPRPAAPAENGGRNTVVVDEPDRLPRDAA